MSQASTSLPGIGPESFVIVLVSSVAAHRTRGASPVYGASKAAVLRLTQQLAL